jgi:hypothetical protein
MTPEQQRAQYRASCTHYRKGHVVHKIDGSVEFTGKFKVRINKDETVDMPVINEAKRYVRYKRLRSYTVKP